MGRPGWIATGRMERDEHKNRIAGGRGRAADRSRRYRAGARPKAGRHPQAVSHFDSPASMSILEEIDMRRRATNGMRPVALGLPWRRGPSRLSPRQGRSRAPAPPFCWMPFACGHDRSGPNNRLIALTPSGSGRVSEFASKADDGLKRNTRFINRCSPCGPGRRTEPGGPVATGSLFPVTETGTSRLKKGRSPSPLTDTRFGRVELVARSARRAFGDKFGAHAAGLRGGRRKVSTISARTAMPRSKRWRPA